MNMSPLLSQISLNTLLSFPETFKFPMISEFLIFFGYMPTHSVLAK